MKYILSCQWLLLIWNIIKFISDLIEYFIQHMWILIQIEEMCKVENEHVLFDM